MKIGELATAGSHNLPVNESDRFILTRDFVTMRSIGVTQEFTRSDKRGLRHADKPWG
jgi:hypothetical protein